MSDVLTNSTMTCAIVNGADDEFLELHYVPLEGPSSTQTQVYAASADATRIELQARSETCHVKTTGLVGAVVLADVVPATIGFVGLQVQDTTATFDSILVISTIFGTESR